MKNAKEKRENLEYVADRKYVKSGIVGILVLMFISILSIQVLFG